MIFNTYTIDEEHSFSAGSTTQLDIPESGYITEILCLSKISVTAGTSVSAAEDALARLINAMQITAAGGKNYYDITDGRQGLYREYMRRQGQIQIDSLPSAGNSSTCRMLLVIHPGLNPYDAFDRSIVIPAAELSNLKHKVTWGYASNLGTGYTINSGTMSLTVNEVVLEAGEKREDVWPQGINVPMFEAREIAITATASNLGKTDDVPVGNMLNSVLVMVLNNAGNRTDVNVSDVGIKFPKQVRVPFQNKWYELKARMRAYYNLPSDLTGLALIPLSWVSKRAVGLDLTAAMAGDVKLGFTIDVGSGTIHLLYFSIGLA
jgi:hypothetical protein